MIIKKFVLAASTSVAMLTSLSTIVMAADAPLTGRAKEIAERFAAADKNHDGKLTLEEAKAGMPRIAEAFSKIDTDERGYLTLAQIEEVAANAP